MACLVQARLRESERDGVASLWPPQLNRRLVYRAQVRQFGLPENPARFTVNTMKKASVGSNSFNGLVLCSVLSMNSSGFRVEDERDTMPSFTQCGRNDLHLVRVIVVDEWCRSFRFLWLGCVASSRSRV